MKEYHDAFVDVLIIAGWLFVSVGTYFLNSSAGLIVSGALLIAGGVAVGRGGAD
jgi:hypothetical protein